MDKYRKIYNENFLGTSDISILKFYYASFKIQQQKGKVATNINQYLDDCVNISSDTGKLLRIFGILPFVNSWLGTGKEQERIADLINSKRKEVENLFLQDDITDENVIGLLYDITTSIPNQTKESAKTIEEQLELIKEYVLKCYSINGKKQLGDRIFGYFLKSNSIEAYNNEQRIQAWHSIIGDINPSDIKLLGNPKLNRSNNKDDNFTLLEHLESIQDFYKEIGLQKVVDIIQKDIEKLTSK